MPRMTICDAPGSREICERRLSKRHPSGSVALREYVSADMPLLVTRDTTVTTPGGVTKTSL